MKRLSSVTALSCAVAAACAGGGPSSSSTVQAPPVAVIASPAPAPRVLPVAAPKRPTTTRYFGTDVVDEYAWLEDAKSDDVRAFVDAENALARNLIDALPERPKVRARVAEIVGATSPDWTSLRHEQAVLFALEQKPPKQ